MVVITFINIDNSIMQVPDSIISICIYFYALKFCFLCRNVRTYSMHVYFFRQYYNIVSVVLFSISHPVKKDCVLNHPFANTHIYIYIYIYWINFPDQFHNAAVGHHLKGIMIFESCCLHICNTLPGKLELPTLRLTASRSNQLSYGSLVGMSRNITYISINILQG